MAVLSGTVNVCRAPCWGGTRSAPIHMAPQEVSVTSATAEALLLALLHKDLPRPFLHAHLDHCTALQRAIGILDDAQSQVSPALRRLY